MSFTSLWYLSPTLAASAWTAWLLSRRSSTEARDKRWWRLGSAVAGLFSILAAGAAFIPLGLSANLERAFADEHFSQALLEARLAQIDRLMILLAIAGAAGGVATVLAIADADRDRSARHSTIQEKATAQTRKS